MNTIFDEHEYYDRKFEEVQLEQGEIITCEFTACTFINCSFEGAILKNCRFSDCTFQECNLNLVQITGSAFPFTRFENSKLMGIDWTQGDWTPSGFSNLVGFFGCALNYSTFIGMDISGIQITNCMANEVDFRDANLSKADFTGTDLARSIFGNTDLTEADLSQAQNYEIDPGSNVLKRAKFSLPEAMSLLYNMDIVLVDEDESV